jgi:hypothetical protein
MLQQFEKTGLKISFLNIKLSIPNNNPCTISQIYFKCEVSFSPSNKWKMHVVYVGRCLWTDKVI